MTECDKCGKKLDPYGAAQSWYTVIITYHFCRVCAECMDKNDDLWVHWIG